MYSNIPADEFENVATDLLNNYAINANGVIFRLVELEFYLKSDDHPDPYVHCDPDQLSVGRWYFHKRGGSYKGGTFKGLDITFGDGVFGGILIRAMMTDTGQVIEGPCNCVNAILRVCGCENIPALVDMFQPDYDVFNCNILRLHRGAPTDYTAWCSKRVGLNPARNIQYADAPYRYISIPRLIKKMRGDIVAGMITHHGLTETQAKEMFKK